MTQRINVLFFSLFTTLFGLTASAQNISGNLADTTNKKAISNAVVAILKPVDSILYKFVRTDNNGSFDIKNVPAGKYILMITHPSYADLLDDVTVGADGVHLKDISIIPKSKLLQELIIKSGSPMRIKGDTTIYTADSFKVSANANVEELLKKLPGIQVDKNGQIKAMGETVEKVLVDGEEFFGDDPGMAIKNLRADAVKEVQVYDKKSEQAEFTGIDDGNTKKTINLKLKEDKKHGYFGKIDLAGGLQKNIDDRYNSNILFNSFKGKRKIAGYLLNGNTGQDGLNWEDKNKYGGGEDNYSISADEDGGLSFTYLGGSNDDEPYVNTANGLFINNNIGLQYTNKWNDKQTLNLSPKYNYQDYTNSIETYTQTQVNDTVLTENSRENIHVNRQAYKLNGSYEIKFDSSNTLKVTAAGNISNTQSQSYRVSANTNEDGMINNSSLRDMNTDVDKQALNGSILFKHKFKKLRRTFSVTGNYSLLNTDGTSILKSDNTIYKGGSVISSEEINQQKDYDKNTGQFITNFIYTEPLSKNYSLELNFQSTINKGYNNQITYDYSPLTGKYDKVVDSLTDFFDQRITINKPGFKISYKYKKLKYNFGSGIGITKFNLLDNTRDTNYLRRYNNFFPTASLEYSYKSNHGVRFNYNGTTTQPRIDQLQQLRDNNNYFYQTIGNPNLKPSFTNRFNLSHNSYDFLKDEWMYQSLNFSTTSNAIVNNSIINTSTGQTIVQPVNADGNYNFGFYGGYGRKLKKLDIRVGVNPNASYNHSTQVINGQSNISKNFNAGIGLSASKSKDKAYDISISNDFNYNSNITQQSNSKINYTTNELRADATVYLKKVWSLNSTITFYSRQKTPQFPQSLNNQLWNAKLQRTFKKDEYTAYFSINDILRQNTSVERNFYGNTLTQVTNYRLQQYWLLGFAWNFKNKAGKATEPEQTPK
jgi:hypothetical protein